MHHDNEGPGSEIHYAASCTTRLMHLQKTHAKIDEMVHNTWCIWMTKDE